MDIKQPFGLKIFPNTVVSCSALVGGMFLIDSSMDSIWKTQNSGVCNWFFLPCFSNSIDFVLLHSY